MLPRVCVSDGRVVLNVLEEGSAAVSVRCFLECCPSSLPAACIEKASSRKGSDYQVFYAKTIYICGKFWRISGARGAASCAFVKDALPSSKNACVGSARSTSGWVAAAFSRFRDDFSIIECRQRWKCYVNFRGGRTRRCILSLGHNLVTIAGLGKPRR